MIDVPITSNMHPELKTLPNFPGSTELPEPISRFWSVLARFFSYLFHPLFIPLYVTAFLAYLHPRFFAGYGQLEKNWLMMRVAYTMVFLPLMTVFLLRRLRFIDSFFLETQRDRIIPYVACGIFFFWIYLVFRNQPAIPPVLTAFCLGVFLAVSAALICNIFFKISMHAIGMGGVLGLMGFLTVTGTVFMATPVLISLLLTGVVCSSRLLISNHRPFEIYTGLLLGMSSQCLAGLFYQ